MLDDRVPELACEHMYDGRRPRATGMEQLLERARVSLLRAPDQRRLGRRPITHRQREESPDSHVPMGSIQGDRLRHTCLDAAPGGSVYAAKSTPVVVVLHTVEGCLTGLQANIR